MWLAHPGRGLGSHDVVAHVRSAVVLRVRAQDLAVTPRPRHADAVAAARHGSEIQHDDGMVVAIPAQETQHRVSLVLPRQPLKAVAVVIEAMQSGRAAVDAVQVAHERAYSGVPRLVGEMPWQRAVMIPL